ncbi:MAG: chemotaxis response regulator protein-glutamate methylesterase [Nitrospiria bacterium]
MPDPIRILVVDDSIIVRKAVTEALASDSEICVVGSAANGKIALAKIPELKPDVLILDIEMPICDGYGVLREIRKRGIKVWTIMFSTLTKRGAVQTIKALTLGAHDYVSKPTTESGISGYQENLKRIAAELIPKIKQFRNQRPVVKSKIQPVSKSAKPLIHLGKRPVPEVLAIGISTGGPEALSKLLPEISEDFPVPIVIVQHMPKLFTKMLADRLDKDSKISVKEGAEGMILKPGTAYVAPGDHHLCLHKNARQACIALNQKPPQNSCRPSADYLFRSVAEVFGGRALGIIMTGMGQDGLDGLRMVKAKGGYVIAQDQSSSVIWGMPAAVVKAGLADAVLPLYRIAKEIEGYFKISIT